MGVFRCPVCDNKIGFLKKCRYSIWEKGNIDCLSCGSRLRIKKYGSSRSDAGLIVCIAYFFLGIKVFLLPLCFLGTFVFSFFKKVVSPLELYDPDQKAGPVEWIIIFIAVISLLVGLWLEFANK